ncbi:MAG: TetR/AcrR family transcriptional regulator [Bacteroidota bacterium]
MTQPSLTAQRRAEEKEQRRQSILDAAEHSIGRKGLDALTMGDIAEAARLSRGLVYVYFQDKIDLFNALAHQAMTELTSRFQAAVAAHEEGISQIRAVGHAYITFAYERPVLFEALARFETRELDPDEAEHHEAAMLGASHSTMETMIGAIAHGQADGSIRPDLDPAKTAVTLWGFIHGMIQVGSMKNAMLEQQFGFDSEALMGHAFEMADLMLRPS